MKSDHHEEWKEAREAFRVATEAHAAALKKFHAATHDQLVADLHEHGFGMGAGVVGGDGKMIASHPVLGQVSARDAETLLRRAQKKSADAASHKPVNPPAVPVEQPRAVDAKRETMRVVRVS